MKRTSANLILLMAGAVWGMGFVAQQTAMDDIAPMLFIGLRFVLAGLVVTPFALLERKRASGKKLNIQNFYGFVLVGTIFFLAQAFQQTGLLTTTVTNSGFLTALYVVLVPVFLTLFLGERPNPIIWPSSVLALAGIYLLSGGDIGKMVAGDWLTIICAALWAWHVILVGKIGHASDSPVTMTVIQFFVAGFLGLAFHIGSGITPFAEATPSWQQLYGAVPEILYAGAIAGGLAFTLQAIGQRYTSAGAAAIMLSSESLFAALFGAIFIGDAIGWIGYLGCAMIFAAILIVELGTIWLTNRKAGNNTIT